MTISRRCEPIESFPDPNQVPGRGVTTSCHLFNRIEPIRLAPNPMAHTDGANEQVVRRRIKCTFTECSIERRRVVRETFVFTIVETRVVIDRVKGVKGHGGGGNTKSGTCHQDLILPSHRSHLFGPTLVSHPPKNTRASIACFGPTLVCKSRDQQTHQRLFRSFRTNACPWYVGVAHPHSHYNSITHPPHRHACRLNPSERTH